VLGGEVAGEGIDGDDWAHSEDLDVLDLLAQIGASDVDLLGVLLEDGRGRGRPAATL